MAWTTMHFAVGMACSGAAATAVCLTLRRGWRWIPAVMTAGGVWALVPDLPRVFREDFPSLPLAPLFGNKVFEAGLNSNLFFFHRTLDAQPHEYALHGLVIILLLYNAAIAGLMWAESLQRNSAANRAWRAHSRRASGREHGRRSRSPQRYRIGRDRSRPFRRAG